MQILFINPAFGYVGKDKFPLGLGYLAAIARKGGHRVAVADENVRDAVPWNQLKEFDMVGISVTTPALSRMRALLVLIQEQKKPGSLVVAGGHHPTFRPEDVLRAGADVVVRGEGEESFARLTSKETLQIETDEWKKIPGISYCNESGEFHHNPQPDLVQDLDRIPFPAWDVFRHEKYSPMSVITSRGCPYRCSYCAAAAFWEHTVRYRSIKNVLGELDALLSRHHYSFLKFQDSIFTAPRKRAADLLTAIAEKKYHFQWTCETRADALDLELVDLMARAKCKTIMLGLESGSQSVLDQNERKMQVNQFVETCQNIKQRGIGVRVSVIFGLPGETQQTVEDTISVLRGIQPNVTFLNLATAYPGCALEHHAVASHKDQWVRTFGGHGVGGQLILPEGMTPTRYHKLADHLYREIHELNKINWVKESEF